jgi:pentatricopeptide repeat protein
VLNIHFNLLVYMYADFSAVFISCSGLTKLVSQMSREGHWAKSLEVYESLSAVGVRPDTTITNAAISACDKGGQWEKALQLFK